MRVAITGAAMTSIRPRVDSLKNLVNRVATTLHLTSAKPAEESNLPMNATDLLIEQHQLVDGLFTKFENAPGRKRAIFEQIAATLIGHDTIERELFYPACEKALGSDDDSVDESLVEHGLVEFCIYRAEQCDDETYFDSYVNVLKEVVQHHVREEQSTLLPKARRAIDGQKLEALGEQMKARFAETQKGDWRQALGETMRQIISGKTKIAKASKAATPARRTTTTTATTRHSTRAASSKKNGGSHAHRRSRTPRSPAKHAAHSGKI